jgi:hypothetical protein
LLDKLTHITTKQLWGETRPNLLDALIADAKGRQVAQSRFSAEPIERCLH